MKRIKTFWAVLLTLCSMSIIYSCSSNDEPKETNPISTYEVEDISDDSATLCACIPLKYKNDFDFEISKQSNMEELVHYNVSKQLNLPNSEEGNLILKITVEDLDPNTDYYYRIAVVDRLTETKKYGETLSFTTSTHTLKELTLGKARFSDTGEILNSFNVNMLLTSGTASGKIEKHNVILVTRDRENFDEYKPTFPINVWRKELTGQIYAYVLKINDTEQGIYMGIPDYHYESEPLVQESNNVIYYESIPISHLYAGSTESFNSDIMLKPTMAEINITVVGCGENSLVPVYLQSSDITKSIFYAGWIDLATGEWTKDEQGSAGKWSKYVAGDANDSGTIRKRKFYYPPSEFDENEIIIHAGKPLILPKTKWEAGHVYDYRIQI